jgi:hypothetical protein
MPISNNARTSRHALDQRERCKFSTAKVAISQRGELGPRYDFSFAYAGRPLSRYRID